MGSRFEKTIAAGVMAGAIALAGCGGGGGGGGGGEDDTTAPAFLGGRTISSTKIELSFSEPVTIGGSSTGALLGGASAAAGLFSITANRQNFGVHSYYDIDVSPLTGKNVVATAYHQFEGYAYYSAWYSFTSGIGALSDVTQVSAQDTQVILTLGAPIPQDADDGTGMLRLSYTADAAGIQDAAGNLLPDIALGKLDRGNVADTVGPGSEGPILIDARTINAQTVLLTFNEDVKIVDANDAIDSFAILNNAFRYDSPNGLAFYPYSPYETTPGSGKGFLACGFYFSLSSVSEGFNLACDSVELFDFNSALYVTAVTRPADAPNTLLIKLDNPGGLINSIPGTADHGTGRLRLYFNEALGAIEDTAGNAMQRIVPPYSHWGNVKDTIGN